MREFTKPRIVPALALGGLFAIGLTGMAATSYIPAPAERAVPHVQFEAELNSFEPGQKFISPDGKTRLCNPRTAALVCHGAHAVGRPGIIQMPSAAVLLVSLGLAAALTMLWPARKQRG